MISRYVWKFYFSQSIIVLSSMVNLLFEGNDFDNSVNSSLLEHNRYLFCDPHLTIKLVLVRPVIFPSISCFFDVTSPIT